MFAWCESLRSQDDGGDVGEFGDHVFDDSAGVEFGAIVDEEGEVAGEEGAEV